MTIVEVRKFRMSLTNRWMHKILQVFDDAKQRPGSKVILNTFSRLQIDRLILKIPSLLTLGAMKWLQGVAYRPPDHDAKTVSIFNYLPLETLLTPRMWYS